MQQKPEPEWNQEAPRSPAYDPLQRDVTSECPASRPKQPKASHTIEAQSQDQQQPPALPIPAKSSKEAPSDRRHMTPAQQRQSRRSKQYPEPPPIATSRAKGPLQTEYGTADEHNGAGVKTDGRSWRDEWPKYQRIGALDQLAAKYGWQEPNGIYTRQHTPSEAPTGCNWASTTQRHSLLPPSTSMGNAAAHQEGPPYITVATTEPSSHGSRLKAWNQEIKNTKNQAWIPQHLSSRIVRGWT